MEYRLDDEGAFDDGNDIESGASTAQPRRLPSASLYRHLLDFRATARLCSASCGPIPVDEVESGGHVQILLGVTSVIGD